MPPIFYTEVVERRVERQEGRKDPIEKQVITRYYTEFDPDPTTVLDRFFSDIGDGLPPIFYEIEEFGSSYKIPFIYGIKPLSINIQAGNWGDRIDWTAQWEIITEQQEPLDILGLRLYNWTKTTTNGQEVAEYLFGHKIFGTSQDSAGAFTPMRTRKSIYSYKGIMPGQIDYDALRQEIEQNTSVINFNYTYRPIQNVTDVIIGIEENEVEDELV